MERRSASTWRAWLLAAALVAVPGPGPGAGSRADTAVPAPHSAHAAMTGDPDSGVELLGQPAPPWRFQRWVRGGPLTLPGLRGKVVLFRFWTEHCRFCETTLPALEQLRRRYGDRGLVVVGAFHPERAHQRVSDARITALADSLGFGGPIACDRDWATLDRWWLDGHPDRDWVSASFLIDRDGVVRWVHGGGEYHESDDPRHHRCEVKLHELEAAIEPLLGTGTAAAPASAGGAN